METLLKADIFFFVTTVAVLALAALAAAVLVYVIKILRDAKYMSERIRGETDELINDFRALRGKIREEGMKWAHLAEFFGGRKKGGAKVGHERKSH